MDAELKQCSAQREVDQEELERLSMVITLKDGLIENEQRKTANLDLMVRDLEAHVEYLNGVVDDQDRKIRILKTVSIGAGIAIPVSLGAGLLLGWFYLP